MLNSSELMWKLNINYKKSRSVTRIKRASSVTTPYYILHLLDSSTMISDEILKVLRSNWGDNLASYLEKPIQDKSFLRFVQERLLSFKIREITAPFTLLDEQVYDIGGNSVNESWIIALIDLNKNKSLIEYLTSKLSYEVNNENTFVSFVIHKMFNRKESKKFGRVTFSYNEFILVNTIKNGKEFAVHILSELGLQILFYGGHLPVENSASLVKKLNEKIPHKKLRFTELFNGIATVVNNQWSFYPYKPHIFLSKGKSMHHVAEWYKPNYCMVVDLIKDKKSNSKDSITIPYVPPPTPIGDTFWLSSDINSGPSDSTFDPGSYVPSPEGVVGDITGTEDGELLYGSPNGGGAYAYVCNSWSTRDGCKECCRNSGAVAQTTATALLAACIAGSFGIGTPACIVAYIVATGIIVGLTVSCANNCDIQFFRAYDNPLSS